MAYKVAFTSSDGKVVNEHFGRATRFHIVEIDDKSYKYIESRINDPACKEFEHTEEGMNKSISLISDCKAVFVSKIGRGALEMVTLSGIKAFEAPYFIEDILRELIEKGSTYFGI